MDYRIGLRQVFYILEKDIEEKLWNKWLAIYPNMKQDTFISFTEFKEMHKPQKKVAQSDKKRIDKMVDGIRAGVVRK